jgi:4-nitrophenyl phosphatase
MKQLSDLQAAILDMDGVLYRGDTPLPGAPQLVAWLAEERLPFLLLTNNSTLDPAAYELKLAQMGIDVPADQIITSAVATADFLTTRLAVGAHVYVIGEDGLQATIAARGFVITDRDPQAVVVGLDRQLTYAKLRTATLAIRSGAAFIATNTDRTLPTEIGEVPGAGAIVAALEAATGVAPTIVGKPEPPMMAMAIARMGKPNADTVAIGDRLETDIAGGHRLGLPTVLLLSGVTRVPPPAGATPQPTWVFADAAELLAAWRSEVERARAAAR